MPQEQIQEQQELSFNSMLFRAVEVALSETIGDSGARALGFYLQASLIAKNPDGYSAQLREIFSSSSGNEDGPKMIEEKIASTLAKLIDSQGSAISRRLAKGASFSEVIEEYKKDYIKTRMVGPAGMR